MLFVAVVVQEVSCLIINNFFLSFFLFYIIFTYLEVRQQQQQQKMRIKIKQYLITAVDDDDVK